MNDFSPRSTVGLTRRKPSNPSKKASNEKGYACPKCGRRTNVRDSRQMQTGEVRRRRTCSYSPCSHRFTTIETNSFIVDDQREDLVRRLLNSVDVLTSLADEIRAEH